MSEWWTDPRMLAAGNVRDIPGGDPDRLPVNPSPPRPLTPQRDNAIVKVAPSRVGTYPSRRTVVYIRNHPGDRLAWRGTDGSYMRDDQMETFFTERRAAILDDGDS